MTAPTPPVALKACPFCGGAAKRITLTADDGPDNEGGDVIVCQGVCGASSHVEFGRKENLVSLWNQRTTPDAAAMRGIDRKELIGTLAGVRSKDGAYLVPTECLEPAADAVLTMLAAAPAPTEAGIGAGEGERIAETANRLAGYMGGEFVPHAKPPAALDEHRAALAERIRAAVTYEYMPMAVRTLLSEAEKVLATSPRAAGEDRLPHVFLDCDGVLADFDTYAEAYFDMNPREYEKKMGAAKFWAELEAKGDFYRNLPLMPDAMALYEGVKHLHPTILTGCPRGDWAQGQKVAWAAEHFPGVPIITCRSADKRDYAKPGDVLIDDWPQHRHRWIEMGGVFINHHDAASSLAALFAHYPALRSDDAEAGK